MTDVFWPDVFWPAGPLWPLALAFRLLIRVNKGLCLFHLYFKPAHQLLRAQYKTSLNEDSSQIYALFTLIQLTNTLLIRTFAWQLGLKITKCSINHMLLISYSGIPVRVESSMNEA